MDLTCTPPRLLRPGGITLEQLRGVLGEVEVDPAVSQGLMTARYKGDESKKDIHEKDLAYLARSHEAADYCARTLGWIKVSCTEQGAMRPIEAIHADLLQAIKEVL